MAGRTSRSAWFPLAGLIAALLLVPACGGSGSVEVAVPVVAVLPAGSPLTGVVVLGDIDFYASAVSPGAFYKVSITSLSDDADLLVYGADGTFTVLAACSIDNTGFGGPTPEDCVLRAAGSTLYLAVDGTFLAGTSGVYTVSVEPVTTTALALSVPAAGSVGRREARIYAVPAPLPGSYTISITGPTDDADLYVFGADALLSAQAVCLVDNTQLPGTVPEDCTFLSGGGTLYFVVDGIFSTAAAAGYTALAAAVP